MAVAGLVLQAVGTAAGVVGQIQQTKALKKQEALREKQMNLDAMRQRREVIRNAMMARATALSSATQQGAQFGSGLQGGYGQIAGRAGGETLAINQNQTIGQGIFKANRQYYNASILTDIGSGLTSLGGMLVNNAGAMNRVGSVGAF